MKLCGNNYSLESNTHFRGIGTVCPISIFIFDINQAQIYYAQQIVPGGGGGGSQMFLIKNPICSARTVNMLLQNCRLSHPEGEIWEGILERKQKVTILTAHAQQLN
jgi:hypothetical protein